MSQGYQQPGAIRDQGQLRSQLDQQARKTRDATEGDVVVEMPRRLFLRAANGHYFQVQVTDVGVLTVIDVGATLP